MKLQLSTNSVGFVHESELFFDSMFEQVLDCLKRNNQPVLEIWVIYESMKKQVLEVAEDRWGTWQAGTSHIMAYTNELLALEFELLTSGTADTETRSLLLMVLAMVYYRIGDPSKAKQIALVARQGYGLSDSREQLAFADLLLTLCSMEMGELEEAGDRCLLALHEISTDQDPVSAAQIRQIYAQVLHKLERTDEAVAIQLLAYEMFGRQGAVFRQVKSVLDLSLLLASQGDWHGGIYYLKKILPACRKQGLTTLELEVLYMLSHLFQKTGQPIEETGCKQRISQIVVTFQEKLTDNTITHWSV